LGTFGAGLVGAAPAQAAPLIPSPAISYSSVSNGSAIESGSSITDQQGGVAVGTSVRAAVGAINYNVATAVGYKLRWFSCPSAGAAINSCQAVASNTGNGSATGKVVEYTPAPTEIGRFLAAEFEIISSTLGVASTVTVTSTRTQDIKVVAGVATSARPAWSTTTVSWTPGGQVSVIVSPWTLPAGMTQTLRSLTVWACDSPDAGQVPTVGFSTAGCTILPAGAILTNVNVAGTSVAKVQTTAAMNGKYLIGQSNLVAASNGSAYAFAVRSAPALLGTGTTVPSASPSPDPTASPTTESGSAGDTASGDSVVRPQVTIVAKRQASRGKALGVAVQLSSGGGGTTGTGKVTVVLVKAPDDSVAVARLKPISVKNLKGFRNELMPKSLKKGTYYLRATYVDAGSGVEAAAVKRITVR
jgi:hypothetical protein